MWCRAILTITLLACTFQRTNGQSHDTKDLLCVLILSGLQKDDLDVALLRKLKRHNVNINDLDNADIRYECKLENANQSDNETKNDVQKSMRRYFQSNHNTSDKVQTKEVNATNEEENITKLIKLIGNITPEFNIHSTKEEDTSTTLAATLVKTHNKSEPNSITYINKVLQQFFAQVHAAAPITTSPATTVDLKKILYEIKDMLAKKTVNGRKESTENKNSRQEYNFDDDSLKIKVYRKALNNRIMNKIKGLRRQKENVDMFDRSQEVLNERPIKDDTELLSLIEPLPKKTTKGTNHAESTHNDIKIPGDVIKDIAESVKAIVLQDLKKEITTTTPTTTTTTTTTSAPTARTTDTETTTETTTKTNTKQETNFAQIIQLFQRLQNNIIPVVNNNVTGQIQHEIKSSIKVTPTLTTIPNNPYNNPILGHIIQNIQLPNTLTNLNTELQSLPLFKQHAINRIDQVNIFNPKHEIHPITIQTNVGQVPPLNIPMIAPPLKMIYQNIVVTTENSFEYFKHLHKLKSTPNINTQYLYSNDNTKLSSKPQHAVIKMVDSPKYYLNSFDRPKFHSQVERMRTPSYYISPKYNPKQEYGHMRSKNHNFERFHERLERADRDDWQQYPTEHNNVENMRVAPREQRPLNDNNPKFDDTHFKNFLKTQQKVNDMLERILATKTIEGPKSVETL